MGARLGALDRSVPKDGARGGADADHAALLAVLAGRLQEDAIAPDDGRAVADAGDFALPEDVLLSPLDGDVLVLRDAAAVGPAETWPVVGAGRQGQQRGAQDERQRSGSKKLHGWRPRWDGGSGVRSTAFRRSGRPSVGRRRRRGRETRAARGGGR